MAVTTDIGVISARARTQISKQIMNILKAGKWDNGKNLSWRDKGRLQSLYKFTNDPNAKAGAIAKVVSSIGTAGASLAANIGEIIAGTILPKEQTKREEIAANKEVSKASIAANKAIQESAIQAGIWNAGLGGNPDNNGNQQVGSDGKNSGAKTPGESILGGWGLKV